jgi:hypothetical protein
VAAAAGDPLSAQIDDTVASLARAAAAAPAATCP